MVKIYLAGAITGLPSRGATWRDEATVALSPLVVVNPLTIELPSHEPRDIVCTDLEAIARCGAVLLNARQPSWGSAVEIWHAKQRCIPVVAFNVHAGVDAFKPSPWLLFCATETHVEMADAVKSIREKFLADL